MIKDQILLENNYSLLQHRCFYCRSLTHTIKNCNYLHYIPDIEKIIKRHDFYNDAPRQTFSRKIYPKFSKHKIKKDAKKILKNQEKIEATFIKFSTSYVTEKSLQKKSVESLKYLENRDCISDSSDNINYLDEEIKENDPKQISKTKLIENECDEVRIQKKKPSSIPQSSFQSTFLGKHNKESNVWTEEMKKKYINFFNGLPWIKVAKMP